MEQETRGDSAQTYRDKKRQYLVPGISTYYKEPIVVHHGSGCYLYSSDGEKYLDFFGGILTVSIGHAHPEVNAAVEMQIHQVVHASTLYINEPMVNLAEELARVTPVGLEMSFFTSSGTEANETAVSMARLATGNYDVVALRHSYSGRSSLAATLTGQSPWRMGQPGVPGIVHAKSPYVYRSPRGLSEFEILEESLDDLEETILTSTSGKIAAVLVEPIQGVGGFIPLPDGYIKEAKRLAHKHGGVLIVDEVQTGFGRTGAWFGVDHHDTVPDIMTFAKGMANGFPIGATITTRQIGEQYKGPTISTFGGNPVSMTAALTTLHIIERDGLVENSSKQGERLRRGLEQFKLKYDFVGDVRGKGLMQAVELVHDGKEPAPELAAEFMEQTKIHGLLVGKGGLYGNAIRIAPPLTVTEEQIDGSLVMIEEALRLTKETSRR